MFSQVSVSLLHSFVSKSLSWVSCPIVVMVVVSNPIGSMYGIFTYICMDPMEYFLFSPRTLGKWSNLTTRIFWTDGWEKTTNYCSRDGLTGFSPKRLQGVINWVIFVLSRGLILVIYQMFWFFLGFSWFTLQNDFFCWVFGNEKDFFRCQGHSAEFFFGFMKGIWSGS